MSRVSKKERRRLKRKRKHKQAIRLRNESPYRRLESAGSVERCLINDGWRETGQVVIYVLCRAPGGPAAMGSFLIDLWCAGLKDAWGRLDFTREDLREVVDHMSWGTGLNFVDCQPDVARKLIAGSIRFAQENGFRLPARHERWLAVVGGVGDWRTADLSDFGAKGKLRWVGPMADLRRRLVGTTVEEFLAREDVECIVGVDDLDWLDESTEAMEADVQMFDENMLSAIRRWCFANGEVPHPRLPEAVDITLGSVLEVDDYDLDEADEELECAAAVESVADMLAAEGPEGARQLSEAMEQVQRFISSFPSPEAMLHAIGLAAADEEE